MSYSLRAEGDRVVVVYRPSFSVYRWIFAPLWVAVWVTIAIGPQADEPRWLTVLVFLFFGGVTLGVGYGWIFDLLGREELEFTPDALTDKRILFGLSRTRMFEIDKIDSPHFIESRRRGVSGSTPTGIGFYYGSKLVRLCERVSQAEAKEIASSVVRQGRQHAKTWARYVPGAAEVPGSVTLDLR